ncbi:MAG: hypothetical protein AAGD07_13955 [Planctomycetota bacterium]
MKQRFRKRRCRIYPVIQAFSAALALMLSAGAPAFAQSTVIPTALETQVQSTPDQRFVIETVTRVYALDPAKGNAPDATARYVTIASPTLVMGCSEPMGESITVLDLARNEMVLLDPPNRRLGRIGLDRLVASTAQARASEQDASKRSRLGMDANPQPEPSGDFQIAYPGVHYHAVTTRAPDAEQARRLGRYVDGICRLNFIQELGPPPFARIRLNEAIARQGRFISTLALNIQPQDSAANLQASFVRSEVTWRSDWTQSDMDRYRQVEQMLNSFQETAISSITSKGRENR